MAIFLAVAALGGWVPGIVFFNMAEVVAYGKWGSSKAFVVDRTDKGDNQGRGSLSAASFCGDEPTGVLSKMQGGVGGFNLSAAGIKVGVGGDIMQ
jgi:hypothetical protein